MTGIQPHIGNPYTGMSNGYASNQQSMDPQQLSQILSTAGAGTLAYTKEDLLLLSQLMGAHVDSALQKKAKAWLIRIHHHRLNLQA